MKNIQELQQLKRNYPTSDAIPSIFKDASEVSTGLASHIQCGDTPVDLSKVLWRNLLYKVVLYF